MVSGSTCQSEALRGGGVDRTVTTSGFSSTAGFFGGVVPERGPVNWISWAKTRAAESTAVGRRSPVFIGCCLALSSRGRDAGSRYGPPVLRPRHERAPSPRRDHRRKPEAHRPAL